MIEIKNGHVRIKGLSPEIITDVCCLLEAFERAGHMDLMLMAVEIYDEHKQKSGKIEEAAEIIKKMDPEELLKKIKEAQEDKQ